MNQEQTAHESGDTTSGGVASTQCKVGRLFNHTSTGENRHTRVAVSSKETTHLEVNPRRRRRTPSRRRLAKATAILELRERLVCRRLGHPHATQSTHARDPHAVALVERVRLVVSHGGQSMVAVELGLEHDRFYDLVRWGDAPIKFLGVNLFMPQKHIQPVQGFTYQHGAVYTV